MAKLFIPTIGAELRLACDWHFRLVHEHRNDTLMERIGLTSPFRVVENFWSLSQNDRLAAIKKTQWRKHDGSMPSSQDILYRSNLSHPIVLPAGALLKLDRIYIRKGASDFDSVTFWLKAAANEPVTVNGHVLKKSVRFWACLDDVNNIEFQEGA